MWSLDSSQFGGVLGLLTQPHCDAKSETSFRRGSCKFSTATAQRDMLMHGCKQCIRNLSVFRPGSQHVKSFLSFIWVVIRIRVPFWVPYKY